MASSELLKQIQTGKKLKKAETNDRSAPVIDKQKTGGVERASGPATVPTLGAGAGAGPPQLGNLFAGGIPKLKPAGQNNLAKPPTLGRPPTVPKREASTSSVPPTPARKLPGTAPPKPPPNRPIPTVPSRTVPSVPARPSPNPPSIPARLAPAPPAAPSIPPRRPPPPVRTASPPVIPSRPSPPIPSRSSSPPGVKVVPGIPPRNIMQAVAMPGPSMSGRGPPPPPPPRPSSITSVTPTRTAPPPPARKAQSSASVPSSRVREPSEDSSPPLSSAPPTLQSRSSLFPPPTRIRTASGTTTLAPPPSRTAGVVSNGEGSGKIAAPPTQYGRHTFEVSGFPAPREFQEKPRTYVSGRQYGSGFDMGVL